MREKLFIALLITCLVLVGSAFGEKIVLGDSTEWNYTNAIPGMIDDTWLYWDLRIFGDGDVVQFQRTPWIKHVLLRFDIAGAGLPIGPNTIIDSAVLDLSDAGGGHEAQAQIEVYYVLQPWVESVTHWGQFAADQNWEVAGATGASDIEYPVALTLTGMPTVVAWERFNIVEFKPMFQAWANGKENHGLLMKYADEATSDGMSMNFCSSEWLPHVMPYLTITYHIEEPPSGAGLVVW